MGSQLTDLREIIFNGQIFTHCSHLCIWRRKFKLPKEDIWSSFIAWLNHNCNDWNKHLEVKTMMMSQKRSQKLSKNSPSSDKLEKKFWKCFPSIFKYLFEIHCKRKRINQNLQTSDLKYYANVQNITSSWYLIFLGVFQASRISGTHFLG